MQGFIKDQTDEDVKVYTGEAKAYIGKSFDHEYVREQVHTNSVESFWSMLKRGYLGTYHYMTAKHLQRYVDKFSGRHKVREEDTIDQMEHQAAMKTGNRQMYRDLVAD